MTKKKRKFLARYQSALTGFRDGLAGVRQMPERGPLRDEYVRGWCRAQKLRRLGMA